MKLAERARQAGYRLNTFDTLGSTNAEGLSRAMAGDRGRVWLVATRQSAGRGRQGRAWSSPAGNLHASLLLVDAAPQAVAPQLAFVSAVALFDAVAAVLGTRDGLAIKWPNDLLADGAKLAGVLVEGTRPAQGGSALVAGFGVNCRSHPGGLLYPANDLSALTGRAVEAAAVFESLSATVLDALDTWQAGRGFDAIRREWLARATPPGTAISVSTKGERLSGTFEGVHPDGRLLLRTVAGTQTIDVGDVVLHEGRPPADLVSHDDRQR